MPRRGRQVKCSNCQRLDQRRITLRVLEVRFSRNNPRQDEQAATEPPRKLARSIPNAPFDLPSSILDS